MRPDTRLRIPMPWRPWALGTVVLLLAGCSAGASTSPSAPAASAGSGGTAIAIALSEFKIELDAPTAAAGSVTFDLTNAGTTVHEFVVFRTDLAPDKLPLSADGKEVDEEGGAGITAIDEVEDLEPAASSSLTVDLPAGHYVLICNLPAHYTSGMHAEFTTN